MASKFHDDSYLVRVFDFVRFFEVPHTQKEAMDRFGISRRTFSRMRESLYCAGIDIVAVNKPATCIGESKLYKSTTKIITNG